jgi:hypothetical protein
MAGKLAPSLYGLYASINFLWPTRNKGIDGWYHAPQAGYPIGHQPGHNGYSHAIDVDRRGINPQWIIDHINRRSDVTWYIIWDVRIWSTETGWNGHPYKVPAGGSDHRDHMHIEIKQTSFAEGFQGPWFGSGGSSSPPADGGGGGGGIGAGLSAADPRDYRGDVYDLGHGAEWAYNYIKGASNNIRGSMGY